MNHPPAHTSPASLAIGVVGRHPAAAVLARVLRDFGQHRVIGFGLDQNENDVDELPVAECPTPEALVRLSDLVLLTSIPVCAVIAAASDNEGTHPPVVVVVPTPRLHLRLVALRLRGRNSLGYNPVLELDSHTDSLASPERLWVASQNPSVHDLVERMWRPISNRVPVVRTGFSRVSETGLLLPPAASDDPPRVSTPPDKPTPPGRDSGGVG